MGMGFAGATTGHVEGAVEDTDLIHGERSTNGMALRVLRLQVGLGKFFQSRAAEERRRDEKK